MTPLSYVFLGAAALVVTVLTLQTTDDQLAIITGVAGTIGWLIFAFYSLDITVISSGITVTQRYPAMAVFGLVMAMPNVFIALTGPLELVDQRGSVAREEVR